MSFLSTKLNQINGDQLRKLISIDHEAFPFPWTDNQWTNAVDQDRYFVIFDDKDQCFSLFDLSIEDGFSHLLKICVKNDARSHGLGQRLFEFSETALRNIGISTIFLEVETTNLPAISLYKKNLFKLIHTKNKFYSNGANAYIFEKHLSDN